MQNIIFLSVDDVLAFHADTILREGGAPGLRDAALLASAVAMPPAMFGGVYLHPTLAEMAAAYLIHLRQAHAFVDGNKRVTVLSCAAFLDVNGFEFSVTADELFELVMTVADSTTTKDELMKTMPGMIRPRS